MLIQYNKLKVWTNNLASKCYYLNLQDWEINLMTIKKRYLTFKLLGCRKIGKSICKVVKLVCLTQINLFIINKIRLLIIIVIYNNN